MKKRVFKLASVFILTTVTAGATHAEVSVPGLFSDQMVLQRDIKLPVWGTASPDEQVTVKLGEHQASATADSAGRWRVQLDPLPAGGPFEMTIKGTNTIVLKDVLVGEVWVCSGQSNMAFALKHAVHGEQEVAAADHPRIRLFVVPRTTADEPQTGVGGAWKACAPDTAGSFSAVGYFFGRQLQETLNVPIGLIDSSWGGTPAEAWTARSALDADPDLKATLEAQNAATPNPAPRMRARSTRPAGGGRAGRAAANRPRAAGGRNVNARNNPRRPSVLYNAMIHPLIPYAIRGAIWYQGEANARRACAYRKLLPTMIRNWRSQWGEGDFPFLIVQLANFQARQAKPYASDWAELREAQLMTLSEPNTGLAVTIDIGNPKDIHPRNKQEVGRRLSLAARAIAYGQKIPYSGPIYQSCKIDGDKVRLRFKHAGGLAARGGGTLTGFAVAGEDRQFVEATATIQGSEVFVSSDQVKKPVAVRYAWGDSPECNLINGAGLPASPFRTDDWPGITREAK